MKETMAMRIDEAHKLFRRFRGTTYEQAATAFLNATVEQARKAGA